MGVGMAASGRQVGTCHHHAGTGEIAPVDGVADSHIAVAHVAAGADRGESGHQVAVHIGEPLHGRIPQ